MFKIIKTLSIRIATTYVIELVFVIVSADTLLQSVS